MAKRLIRVGTVGVVALLALSFAPSAAAKYPPTIPNRACIDNVRSPVPPGGFTRVRGAPGCALRPNTQDLTRVQVRFNGEIRRWKFKAQSGRYRFRFRVRLDTPEGRARLVVRAGNQVYDRFPIVRHPRNFPANALLAPPNTTLPTLATVAVLAGGGLFMFAPVGRRRRLLLRKAFGRRRR